MCWLPVKLPVLPYLGTSKCWGHGVLQTQALVSVTLNSVFINLTGNEDRHKISDEFELRSYLTSHFGVTCP